MVKKIVALLVVASMFSLQTNINAGSVQSSAKNDSRKTQIGNDLAVDPEGKLYKIDYGELEPSADGIVNQVLIIKHTSISEPTADQRAQADNFFAQQAAAHPDAYKRTRGPLQETLELDLLEPRESGKIQPFIETIIVPTKPSSEQKTTIKKLDFSPGSPNKSMPEYSELFGWLVCCFARENKDVQ